MGKTPTIHSFFKRKNVENLEGEGSLLASTVEHSISQDHLSKCPRLESNSLDPTTVIESSIPQEPLPKYPHFEPNSFERDPGLRRQICDYPVNQHDEIRRAYIKAGPYQPILSTYPKSGSSSHPRRFQASWFKLYPSCFEYSPAKDAVFCLTCFLFNKPSMNYSQTAFTIDGFQSWKKVRDGKNCAFLNHVGKDPNSLHKCCEKSCEDLMNQAQHLQQVLQKQTSEIVANNRLRLKASIDAIRWLAFQGCAMRGRDEKKDSLNRGNFLELLKLLSSYNDKVTQIVLDNAPQNASYTSSDVQKEILHVLADKVKIAIREEIDDAKFCIIVDEARDESKKEQMAIVLRFVDKYGLVRERFLGLVHVSDTTSLTLKKGILSVLSHNSLDIQNIRGQGYDGASNMRGEWNGLQALIANDCRYAYYVHCFAHRLQLALVEATKDNILVYQFFTKLTSIVNIVSASSKRNDELKAAYASEIINMIDADELMTGTGQNQIGTLQRASDTRWSSHLKSIFSLIKMFRPTRGVLDHIIDEGTTPSQRGEAYSAHEALTSFQFIFILHLMKELMEITDMLCQALQRKSQDILNALHLVSSTKRLIQNMRDTGWDSLLIKVRLFCESNEIAFPDMSASYIARRGRARHQQDHVTLEHHYRVDIFIATLDSQLHELNSRFSDNAVELLTLSCSLDPRDGYKSFKIDDICNLADKYYPEDFTEFEKEELRIQLRHYEVEISQHPELQKLTNISELCQWLAETRKSEIYSLIFRLVKLILTLPVSTATTERAFSAMNIIKTRLRRKMNDEFLENSLILYIEREIAEKFSVDSIIDGFRDLKERRVLF